MLKEEDVFLLVKLCFGLATLSDVVDHLC